jgi:hypothetical protein
MDGFKAFKYYIAIKLHFTKDSFDVFKNRGSVKGTREAFNARNDRYVFEKLARKFPVDKELIQYYVANFVREVNFEYKHKNTILVNIYYVDFTLKIKEFRAIRQHRHRRPELLDSLLCCRGSVCASWCGDWRGFPTRVP